MHRTAALKVPSHASVKGPPPYSGRQAVYDETFLPVLPHLVGEFPEWITACAHGIPGARNPRHHLNRRSRTDDPSRDHGVGGGQLDVLREVAAQALHGERGTRQLWIAHEYKEGKGA